MAKQTAKAKTMETVKDLWFEGEDLAAGTIPVGTYELRVVSAEYQKSKNKGTPGVHMQLAVIGPEQKGRVFFEDIWFAGPVRSMKLKIYSILGEHTPSAVIEALRDERYDPEELAEELTEALYKHEFTGVVKEEEDPKGVYAKKNVLDVFATLRNGK